MRLLAGFSQLHLNSRQAIPIIINTFKTLNKFKLELDFSLALASTVCQLNDFEFGQ